MLLSTAYLPPVEYLALLAKDFTLSPDRVIPSVAYIERCEHYQKQSYRTRCRIAGPRGIETLSVPIVHGDDRLIGSIRVEYSTPWFRLTCKTLETAYSSAPFFEHYRDNLFAILESGMESLFDLNLALLRFLLERTGIRCDLRPTTEYLPAGQVKEDYREVIHPKRPNTILRDLSLERPYYQVFAQKYAFQGGLSAIDLLFIEGPDSILFLKNL